MSGPGVDRGWFAQALAQCSDVVVVLAADTTIVWGNPAVERTLGLTPDHYLGRSIAEFLHPDDLARAAEVLDLVEQGRFETHPVTPALYRVRSGAGEWIQLEFNSSSIAGSAGEVLILARFAGDLVYGDELLKALTGGASLDDQVGSVMKLGRWRYPAEGYAIVFHDRGEQRLVGAPGLAPGLAHPAVGAATPWARAMADGSDVAIHDLRDPDQCAGLLDDDLRAAALAAGYAGCLAVPVADVGDDRGACIVVWSTRSGPSLAGHRYAVANMCRSLALVLQQRAQRAQLERAAFVDELTGLASRNRFLDRLRTADEHQDVDVGHIVLYIDLDGFKAVNDGFGHAIGDRVLATAAARLAALAPADAVIGRLGGDEFAILCPPGWTPERAIALAQSIVDEVARPVPVGDRSVTVGASLGLAVGGPGQPVARVLEAADGALLGAKTSGRGQWQLASSPPETPHPGVLA